MIIKTILLIGAGISNMIGFIKGVITAWRIFTALIAANPIGAILTAITIALMLIVQNWDKIKEAAGTVLGWINEKLAAFKGVLQNLAESVKQFFQPIIDYIKNTIAAITDALAPIFDKINSVKDFAGGIKDKISGGIEAVTSFFGAGNDIIPAAALPAGAINNNGKTVSSSTTVSVGAITVTSPNADPKAVAAEIPAAMNNKYQNMAAVANTGVNY